MTSSEDSKDPMDAAGLYTEILQMGGGGGGELGEFKIGGHSCKQHQGECPPPQTPLNTTLCAVKERYLLMYDVALLIIIFIYYDISIFVSSYAN